MAIKIAPRQKKILEFLHKSLKPASTKEISTGLNHNYQVLIRDLRYLTSLRLIKRIPGEGHSYKYKFISWDEEPTGAKAAEYVKARPEDIRDFIQRVTAPGWEPVFAKPEVWNLISQSMLDLHSMFVSNSEGETISQERLNQARNELRKAFHHLSQAGTNLGRILATEELWDASTLGEFLSE